MIFKVKIPQLLLFPILVFLILIIAFFATVVVISISNTYYSILFMQAAFIFYILSGLVLIYRYSRKRVILTDTELEYHTIFRNGRFLLQQIRKYSLELYDLDDANGSIYPSGEVLIIYYSDKGKMKKVKIKISDLTDQQSLINTIINIVRINNEGLVHQHTYFQT